MTTEKLQDAIGLIPSDLVAATDRMRTAPRTRVIQWKRWAAMAACLVLLLSTGLVFRQKILPGMGAKTESAVEAPMAMAPQSTMDSAAPEVYVEEAAPEAPAEITDGIITEVPAAENGLSMDHSHRFAEETETAGSTGAYCGNMVTTVCLDGETYSFGGSDSVALTRILKNLHYDPTEVCRCMAEFTVDMETLTGIEVNLSEAFARCELGQAALTEKQVAIFQEILGNLQ